MANELFVCVGEVAKELGVSKSCAYKIMRRLNGELKEKNFITISGRVSRKYFQERVYGFDPGEERGEKNAGV